MLFMIYSLMGWIYETTFCTVKTGKWSNRGFLYGPICPIYGTGAVAISAAASHLPFFRDSGYVWWEIFLVAFFGSIALEYVTSWVLEMLFHAVWWDYSGIPLNINGRVCLPASCGFGLAGLLIVYIIAPGTEKLVGSLSVACTEAAALTGMALLSADMTLTVSALTNFSRNVMEFNSLLNQHMDGFVNALQEKKDEELQRISEEKQRFADERAKAILHAMNLSEKYALRRVHNFKFQKTSAEKQSDLIKNIKNALEKHRQ